MRVRPFDDLWAPEPWEKFPGSGTQGHESVPLQMTASPSILMLYMADNKPTRAKVLEAIRNESRE